MGMVIGDLFEKRVRVLNAVTMHITISITTIYIIAFWILYQQSLKKEECESIMQ